MVTTVELKETEEIARKYCDEGEFSKFIRKLIIEYDQKQNSIMQNNNIEKKEIIFETIFFLSLGITLLGLAIGTMVDIMLAVNTIFLIVSSLFLFIFVYCKTRKYKRMSKNVIEEV